MNEHNIVDEWLKIAYDDYDSAQHLFDSKHPKPLEIICYHCQQSVEKSLKAFLCAKSIEFQKTHDTGLLCKSCSELSNEFSRFQDACDELTIYATHTRYPIQIDIEEQDAERALRQAKDVYNYVSAIFCAEA